MPGAHVYYLLCGYAQYRDDAVRILVPFSKTRIQAANSSGISHVPKSIMAQCVRHSELCPFSTPTSVISAAGSPEQGPPSCPSRCRRRRQGGPWAPASWSSSASVVEVAEKKTTPTTRMTTCLGAPGAPASLPGPRLGPEARRRLEVPWGGHYYRRRRYCSPSHSFQSALRVSAVVRLASLPPSRWSRCWHR